ncbi:hypothetical protein ASPFODRAFT_213131 [Aspergillus luchuensis CBS 106.47]|uniref:Uncharacterized protein n=1 Tax=Aspergillus luchuensis (strain CBS 106.47) TaxID=1137211 RepID=A0A1M3SZ28_ASPLC|nr:hypothetical protein ASPFODRAFT_213131 [Aspergillus luchuensis CBS 106.47]
MGLSEQELSIQSVSQYDPLAKFTIESSEVNRETRSKYPPREFALNRFTECKPPHGGSITRSLRPLFGWLS